MWPGKKEQPMYDHQDIYKQIRSKIDLAAHACLVTKSEKQKDESFELFR
jgi:hypothetical protein